jgi:hypothetical protein
MDEQKLTPWQAFKDLLGVSKERPLVLDIYNPFTLKPMDFVVIDDVLNGISQTRYQVTEVDLYRRTFGDKTFESVDYILHDPASDSWLTLRVSKDSTPGSNDRTLLLLFPDYEGEYDENLHKNVLPTGILEVKDENGAVLATYERLNGLRDPYRADVLVIASDGPPHHESYDYWDFGRSVDGKEEFYFVEMSTDNGMIHTFRAVETLENELSFLRKSV